MVKALLSYFSPAPSSPSPGSARLTSRPSDLYTCGPIRTWDSSRDTTRRIAFDGPGIQLFAYPSRGGIIILDDTSPADMDFLGLDRLDPPSRRHADPAAEDAFCQRLLLLGAKWWDSVERYWLLNADDVDCQERDESGAPPPTRRERAWVSVAWPRAGGLIVAECVDAAMWGGEGEGARKEGEDGGPDEVARLRLCTSMEEKAGLLRARFGGREWGSVEEYRGRAFLGCWGTKVGGEVGELEQTWETG